MSEKEHITTTIDAAHVISSDEQPSSSSLSASPSKQHWTQKLPWFIPHERIIHETPEEIAQGYALRKQNEEQKQSYHVKEYRDEANRKWWSFFNEYEYRQTKEEQSKHDWWRWFEKDTSTAEKKLLFKLDLLITFVLFLGFWSFSLSQSNLNNAYVSGLKEGIGMKGNDLIDTQVLFSAASLIFQLPLIYTLPRLNPAYMIAGAQIIWSSLTLISSTVQNVRSLQALRFFIGAAESVFFPLAHYTFTNWYRPSLVNRRTGLFYTALYIGTLTSGLLQGSIFESFDGVHGISGWRWMFIYDSVISFIIAFITLFCLPGTPFVCYSIWLTDDEIKLARKIMRLNGTDERPPSKKEFFDKAVWKRIFTSWHFWVLTIANIGGWNGNSATIGSFTLWLKSLNKYPIGKLNKLSSIAPCTGLVWIIITTFGADIFRQRFMMIVFSQVMNMIGNLVLAIWDVPDSAKWFGFCFAYWSWSQSSVFYPLMNDILRKDANQRSIEWVISIIFCNQSNVWLNKILYPTEQAPRYLAGYSAASAFSVLQAVGMAVALVFYKRDERRDAYDNGIVIFNSAKGETKESALFHVKEKVANVSNGEVESIAISTRSEKE